MKFAHDGNCSFVGSGGSDDGRKTWHAAVNELDSDMIYPGEELLIPSATITLPTSTPFVEGEVVVYTVVSGDSLSSIAEYYGVTVEAVMSANNMTSDAIQAGQQLLIPLDHTDVENPRIEPGTAFWQPSILDGDLQAAYPLLAESDRFSLHYHVSQQNNT